MKGLVFTEFLEMVEEAYGYRMVDSLLTDADLPSGVIYTKVGTYDHQEMFNLVYHLSDKTGHSTDELLRTYGRYIFSSFIRLYPQFINEDADALSFLESIEHYIHVEVRKLYPEAELPTFQSQRPEPNSLELIYSSERKMGDFAHGIIEVCLQHFDYAGSVGMQKISDDGSTVKFLIQPN